MADEREGSFKSRTINNTGCPYCSHNKVLAGFNDLASQFPQIAAEWSEKNFPLTPDKVNKAIAIRVNHPTVTELVLKRENQ